MLRQVEDCVDFALGKQGLGCHTHVKGLVLPFLPKVHKMPFFSALENERVESLNLQLTLLHEVVLLRSHQ